MKILPSKGGACRPRKSSSNHQVDVGETGRLLLNTGATATVIALRRESALVGLVGQ